VRCSIFSSLNLFLDKIKRNEKRLYMMLKLIFIVLLISIVSVQSLTETISDCQLLIVGGTTSAFGAILSATKFLGRNVCLLEPTDWAGGQLTAELLSAPDFGGRVLRDGNFTLDVGYIDRQPENRNPLFSEMLDQLGDTGHCTVSPWCSLTEKFHDEVVAPRLKNARIFYNTVVKRVRKDSTARRITEIDTIQRTPRSEQPSCRFLSDELPDWYSPNDSSWFTKSQLTFTNFSFIMEGSSWGEVLALANVSYLQGLMEQYDGDISGKGNATCGQAITYTYLEQLMAEPTEEPPNPLPKPVAGGNYSLANTSWENIWVFRRVYTPTNSSKSIAVDDITIQNWSLGDDYEGMFFFLSPEETQRQRDTDQWQGGVNIETIRNSERHSYGCHYWYRDQAPAQWANRTVFARASSTGTCHHLAKLPYMRESRRSIGYQNFIMNLTMITGSARNLHGYIFDDRLCIGTYPVDIHYMYTCEYLSYQNMDYPVLPYYIPLRAMTHRDIDNLIPIGKTMAQSFLVNAAVRLHPVEFSIGQAAGVVGAYAVHHTEIKNVSEMLDELHLRRIQSIVKQFTPMSWTINGKRYPDD